MIEIVFYAVAFWGLVLGAPDIAKLFTNTRKSVRDRHDLASSDCRVFTLSHDNLNATGGQQNHVAR